MFTAKLYTDQHTHCILLHFDRLQIGLPGCPKRYCQSSLKAAVPVPWFIWRPGSGITSLIPCTVLKAHFKYSPWQGFIKTAESFRPYPSFTLHCSNNLVGIRAHQSVCAGKLSIARILPSAILFMADSCHIFHIRSEDRSDRLYVIVYCVYKLRITSCASSIGQHAGIAALKCDMSTLALL